RDLFPPLTNGRTKHERRVVARYIYTDEAGEPLHRTVRYEPKGFSQQRRLGPIWKSDMKGARLVLYGLPEVLETVKNGERIFLGDGEEDADSLAEIGLRATNNAMGAGNGRDEYTETLRGARVVVIPDDDDRGRDHAESVARSLDGTAKSVRVLHLPDG